MITTFFKKKYRIILRTLISALILTVLLYKINSREVLDRLTDSQWEFFLLLFGLDIAGFFARSWRWKIILEIWDIHIPISTLFFYSQGGRTLNFILPSSIGGDVYRMYLTTKNSNKKTGSIVGIVIDRLTGMSTGFFLAGCATLFLFTRSIPIPHIYIILAIIAGWFVMIGILFSNKLHEFVQNRSAENTFFDKLNKFFISISIAKQHPAVIAKALCISVLVKFHEILVAYFVARALSLPVPLFFCMAFIPVISFLTVLPISISGIGIRESMVIFFFTRIGLTPTAAFSLSITVFTWMALMGMCGGLIYLIWWVITGNYAHRSRAK